MGIFSKRKEEKQKQKEELPPHERAKEIAVTTGEAIEDAGKKVAEGAKEIIGDMDGAIGGVGGHVAEAGKKVVDGAVEIAGDISDDLGEAADKVEETGKKVLDKTR